MLWAGKPELYCYPLPRKFKLSGKPSTSINIIILFLSKMFSLSSPVINPDRLGETEKTRIFS